MSLILYNAKIITMNSWYPEASSILIRNGKIEEVGGTEVLRAGVPRIDCKGRTILPGFMDAHCHLGALAESRVAISLRSGDKIGSIADIRGRIREAAATLPPGEWIRGGGYDEFSLQEKRHPTRVDLDQATAVHPVKLTHRSGHAHVLNSLALKEVGISLETGDPPGGIIERDLETGHPTGLLFGMNSFLARRIPPLAAGKLDDGIREANRTLLSCGITSVQDASAGNGPERWEQIRSWMERGILQPRVGMMLGSAGFVQRLRGGFRPPADDSPLDLLGVKILLDEVTGRLHPEQGALNEQVLAIHKAGLQAAFHAVEEGTIEAACSAVEEVLKKFPRSDHRHRIEHCAVCPPRLARRIASLGIFVVTQPNFIYFNGDRYLSQVPDGQQRHLYPVARLMKNGVPVAAGSDAPIAPVNPLIGIYAAAARKTESGEVLLPEERIAPLEALRMYTLASARAGFLEATRGSIAPGKFADLAVLNGDPATVPVEEIKNLRIEMTVLNGEMVWER